jgi:hypothetical protein
VKLVVPSDNVARMASPRRDDFRNQESPITFIGKCDDKMIDNIRKECFEEGK